MLAVIFLLVDNIREERSVPLTKQSGIASSEESRSTWVENRCSVLHAKGALRPNTSPMCSLKPVCEKGLHLLL